MITVTFHTFGQPASESDVTDEYEGTVSELIRDLVNGDEFDWPYDFVSSTDSTLTFRAINTDDCVTFSTK